MDRKYALVDLETGKSYQTEELEPGKKYIVQIFVGNLPPADVPAFMKKAQEQIQSFFGEAADDVLYLPFRDEETKNRVFKVKE